MGNDFASNSDMLPNAPSFVRVVPGMQGRTDNPCELFDWWAPDRSGDPWDDFTTGQKHSLTAISFARAAGSTSCVANVIGAMMGRPITNMECGFIDLLSRKATCGCNPEPISENVIALTMEILDRTEDELRFRESEARAYLEIARVNQCPDVIYNLMMDAVNFRMGRSGLTFIWTICGAAICGALN